MKNVSKKLNSNTGVSRGGVRGKNSIKNNPENITHLQKIYIELLKEFVSFKTVSTDPSFKKDITAAVKWLTKLFKSKGFSVSFLQGKKTNPVVVAKYECKNEVISLNGEKRAQKNIKKEPIKTVFVYGHYDVQPAEKSDGWKTDPFTLVKKGNSYIARGVVDNKGQILAHMVGVFDAIEKQALNMNVIFVIEGNEESGNDELACLLKKHKKELANDLILISDGEMVGLYPTLDISFRGGGNIKIEYKTSSNDRHSGLFGGAIPNAAFELASVISKLKENNKISFADFYEGTEEVSSELKKQHEEMSKIQPIEKLADVKCLVTEDGVCPCEQIGLRPTIEVSGFTSGYTGLGFKNIVPGKAEARINVRTVFPQNSKKVLDSIRTFIVKNTPAYVESIVDVENHGDPISLDAEHEDAIKIKKLLVSIHDKEVLHKTVGGSIPVVFDFKEVFNKPIVMVSLCNDDCNMHGVDENFSIHHIHKALQFTNKYWKGVSI